MESEEEIKSEFRNNYHKGLVILYYTNLVIGKQIFKTIKKYGLAPPQFNILRILKRQYPKCSFNWYY